MRVAQAVIAQCEPHGQIVRATRADREKTNKISSPQPSPKERECSNGKVGRRNDEQMTVRATQADREKMNKRRTKDEQ